MGKDCKPRQLCNFNYASNVGASVFPNHADPYGFASGEKRFMVFDHSKNQTNLIYNSVGYNGDVNEEEMHEDTEEIDALLYSDSDNYEEEEEGLPPPVKKCRIEFKLDPALADTASSTNCGNGERKRSKREKIQDTVRVLRGIIPDSKGKDAASVLDEAIQYLRSLKLKAKVPGTTSDLK